jgi:serine/threonine-protein kinase
VLIAAVVVLAGLGAAVALTRSSSTPTHPMPHLEGKTETEAIAALRPLKVKVQYNRPFVDGTTAGIVLNTRPLGGTKVHEQSSVRLTVSQGPPPVPVPDLSGASQQTATERLTTAGLAVGVVTTRYDEQVPEGVVLDWNPKGQQPKHTAIALAVSGGPKPRQVPNVAGQPYAQAAAVLQQLGLTPVRADAFSDTVPKDQVIGTTPGTGASVSRGGKVTINVSKGPDLVAVPDVTNKSVQDATTIMQQAGLSIGNVFGPPNKKIFTTDPAVGTQVHRGSSVNVYTK